MIDVHFLIRDRVDDDVVFSFRFLAKKRELKVVKSKIRHNLNQLVPKGPFAINPKTKPFGRYVAWLAKERIGKTGRKKFTVFCDVLSRLSKIVTNLARKNYFRCTERVEVAHVMSWMLGCAEYGLLNTREMHVRYYDRIEDKYKVYIR